jgi:hypothetical protein
MPEDARSALETDLGRGLSPALASLPLDKLAHLSTAFRERRTAQLAELEKAIDEAIDHLPALLRNQARKALNK